MDAYIDVAGARSAISWLDGCTTSPGTVATVGDFADHMTTVFTDVRIKRFLEMRGADAGRADMMVAQSAFWVGLLYDEAALTAAEALMRGRNWEDAVAMRSRCRARALSAPWRSGSLRDLARDAVAIARDGLRARSAIQREGLDESILLAPLEGSRAGNQPRRNNGWSATISRGRVTSEQSLRRRRSERWGRYEMLKPALSHRT